MTTLSEKMHELDHEIKVAQANALYKRVLDLLENLSNKAYLQDSKPSMIIYKIQTIVTSLHLHATEFQELVVHKMHFQYWEGSEEEPSLQTVLTYIVDVTYDWSKRGYASEFSKEMDLLDWAIRFASTFTVAFRNAWDRANGIKPQ